MSEELDTKEALGRILYNNIISSSNIPKYDSSHMDGFAVLHDDLIGATNLKPITLKVIDDIKLGNPKLNLYNQDMQPESQLEGIYLKIRIQLFLLNMHNLIYSINRLKFFRNFP